MAQRRFDDRYQLRQRPNRGRKMPVWVGIFLAVLISAGGVSAAVYFQDSFTTKPITARNAVQSGAAGSIEVLTQNIADNDSDNDNLRDWEESVWSTDRNNPDTDGDGTQDGAEVLADRNPLVPGPKDGIKDYPAGIRADQNYDSAEPYTERFSKELFARYISLKKDDKLLDPAEQASLIEELVDEISAQNAPPKTYTKNDLTIVPQSDRAAFQLFFDQLKQTLRGLVAENNTNELLVIEQSLRANSAVGFKQLVGVETKYHNAAKRMLLLPVPAEISDVYLNVINAHEKMAVALGGIQNLFNDPLQGMSSAQMYVAAARELKLNSDNLDIEMNKRGVY